MSAVYDAGALIAAERGDRSVWARHRVLLERGELPYVPAVVVAQVSRGGRQVQVRRLLRGCDVLRLDEADAHRVGALLAASGTSDVVDGAVVVAALDRAATVLTSDRRDLEHLAQAAGRPLDILDV